MNIFNWGTAIIKTDPTEKPSHRFEKVLFHQLEKEGYTYLKSKNEFSKDFQFGKQVIKLSYGNQIGYIYNIEFSAYIIFNELEKAFKKVFPNYAWTNWTIHTNNLPWPDNWLCDKKTGQYTDKSINIVSKEFFEKVKPQIDKLFEQVNTYEKLNKIYNERPLQFIDYLPTSRLEKRIINGLILARTFEPENFNELKKGYLNLIENYKGNDLEEIKAEVKLGLDYLDNNDLRISK
jgi:hypothetical protein